MIGRRRSKTLEIAFTALGMVIALTSLALWQLTGAFDAQWAVTGMIIGAVLALFGVISLLRKDVPRGDERTRKLGAYATSWSWLSGVAVTSLLYLLDNRGIIQVSASGALAAVLATLLVTAVAFNAYYRSRGDME
jgi:hypothetical protein